MRKHQDNELLKLARKGDDQAFAALVNIHQSAVRRVITAMLHNSTEVDDIAQEVFIRFYKSLDQFKEKAQLSTYLIKITIRASLTAIEKRKKHQERFLSSDKNNIQNWSDKNKNIERLDIKDAIQLALKELSEDQRAVVALRLIQGYTVHETAEILSIPQGTVASRLSRAQIALRRILKPSLIT